MSRPVSSACTAVGLAPAAEVQRLASERTLVDLTVLRTGEGQTVVLELPDGCVVQQYKCPLRCKFQSESFSMIPLRFPRRQRHATSLTLRGLPAHVLDGILITQPVAAFDGIIGMPAPVVLGHVAQGGVDSSL